MKALPMPIVLTRLKHSFVFLKHMVSAANIAMILDKNCIKIKLSPYLTKVMFRATTENTTLPPFPKSKSTAT